MNHQIDLRHLRLAIEYLSIDSLRSNDLNPRKHSPRQINALARSMSGFGFVAPVLIDADNMLIAGHGRIMAARKIGLTDVPAVRVEHLDEHQRRALMIADNRLCDMSVWSDALLADNLKLLADGAIDLDIELTGFTMGEIDLRIEVADAAQADPDDEAIDLPAEQAINQIGDLWTLGSHRLNCGDSRDRGVWKRLMADDKAAMCIADCPYNVPIRGHVSGLGKIVHREFVVGAGELDREGFTDLLTSVFVEMARHSSAGALQYTFIDWRHLGEMQAAGDTAFTELKNVCTWVKDRAGMGSLYRSATEFIFVWKSGRGRHRNNVELGRHGRNRTNAWHYPGIGSFRHSDEGDLLQLHSTVKPVRMIADAILDVTKRGDVVVDPFMGSGSTMIAAERVGRRAYGIELDPLYADTIIRRFERHSGEAAIHVETGKTFAELAAQRSSDLDKDAAHG